MLDLSAAFDAIDHDILLHRLCTKLGISGTAEWFSSYLNCGTQHVAVGTAMSDTSPIYCGIPQGSVLGTVLFCMYSIPLRKQFFVMVCSM